MSKNRMVNTRFWSDNFVVDKLNSMDRLLFLYLLTNDKTNIIGIYELPLRTAAFETGIDKDDLQKMLTRLSPKVEYFDGWIYIRRFTDHQQSNPSVEKGMMREFFNLPDDVITSVKKFGIDSPKLRRAFDMLEQAQTDSPQPGDSLSQSVGNLNLNLNLNSNLTDKLPTDVGSSVAPDTPAPRNSLTYNDLLAQINEKLGGSKQITVTAGRKDKLKQRLKTFKPAQLIEAATAMGNDPYLQGDNDRNKRYGTIDFFLRNNEKIAEYLEVEGRGSEPKDVSRYV